MKPQKPYKKSLSITIVLSLTILGFFIFRQDILDTLAQLNLQSLKDNYASLKIYFNNRPFQSSLVYVAIYILVTALSLPGAVILTLAGGAIFGFIYIKQLQAGKDWARSFSKLIDYLTNTFTQRKKTLKTVHKRTQTDDQWQEKKAKSQDKINQILDKIAQSGYESLNESEKETLFKESKK